MAWFRHEIGGGGNPVDFTSPPHTSQLMLRALTVSWDAAPATSEDFTVTLVSELGPAWDTELYVVDPAADNLTAVLLTDINLPVFVGDVIKVAYANTDRRTIGIQVILSNQ